MPNQFQPSSNPGNGRILGSKWDGLNALLIAKFYAVEMNPDDGTCSPIPDGVEVHAPITGDAAVEYVLNWQSPFEQSGPETKAPALSAMMQSGVLAPVLNAIGDAAKVLGFDVGGVSDRIKQANALTKEFQGRTGLTRLNSTQVFTGMPPVKFPLTLLFRSFDNAYAEVEAPFAQLLEWALPKELSRDGLIVQALKKAAGGSQSVVDVLMPSRAPTLIAMQYKGKTWGPLVIESIAEPITAPITGDGFYAHIQVPITLCTLTAMDAPEMRATRIGANPNIRITSKK